MVKEHEPPLCNGFWNCNNDCPNLHHEKDGNTIIPMCFIHPEAIWGVTEEDCMKCKEVRVCRG